ncbi:MAG: phosphate ABC transporter permease subunit PstC [Anaerolineae bacterium]|nr:phosphate ABC transporter permease subunit PstC [Anaerolineae bacterium]MDX9830942.1 phosphate ABC transporter permease subunit PstC [Anaerolineae bacterium]
MQKAMVLQVRRRRQRRDRLARQLMGFLTLATVLLVPIIAVALFLRALPILAVRPLSELLFSTTWRPLKGMFGFYPFIAGTLWVTAVAMIIAVPPSLLTAIYLAEYASSRLRAVVNPLIDLLAGIPSVVYGVWGVLTVVPLVGDHVAPFLNRWLGPIGLFRSTNPTGYNVLSGGVVLAVMVFPIIIAVAQDVIRAVPQGLREASLALGATRWQTVRRVVLRRAWPGVMAAVVLGFSRAFGETMAVLMVVGNVPEVPRSILDPAYPLTALIANNYGEMMSIPLYDAALLGGALILLLIVLVFNLGARLVLVRLVRNE